MADQDGLGDRPARPHRGAAAWAGVSTGNIYGKVVDDSQAVLPGATATLTGPLGTRTTTADTQGEFRFLNIDHGTHKLVVTLSGVRRRQP